MNIVAVFIDIFKNLFLIASVGYIIIGLWFLYKRKNNSVFFSLLMFVCAIYSIGYFLEISSNNFQFAVLIRNFEFLGTTFLPSVGILFIMQTAKTFKPKTNIKVLLFAISTIFWLLYLSNSYHFLFYRRIDGLLTEKIYIIQTVKGIMFYFLLIYYVVFFVFSSIILLKAHKIAIKRNNRNSLKFLFITFQIPWLAVFFVLFGLDTYIDPVPFIILLITGLLVINEIKYDMSGTENSLKEVENERKLLLENIQAGIVVHLADTSILSCNNMAEKMLGLSLKQMQGKVAADPYWHFVLEDGEPIFIEDYPVSKVLKSKKAIQPYVLGAITSELARCKWFFVNGYPMLDENQQVEKVVITFFDISDKIKNEKNLVNSEINFRTFFNSIDDFLFVLDEQGNMINVNDTVINRLGYLENELIGRNVLMVHPKDKRDEAGKIVGEMISGITDLCNVPIITKSGQLIQVETRVFPGVWNGNKALFGITKDITKIKQSEERFSKAFQAGSSLMAISEIESGLFIDVNEAFLNTTGYSRDEVIGKTSNELNLFANAEDRLKVLQIVKDTGFAKNIEVKIKIKNGEARVGLFSVSKINTNGTMCWLTTMTDITERKLIQEELKKNADRLALAVRAGSVGTWELDVIDNKLVWDDQMFALYGISPDVFGSAYDTWVSRLHPDDVERSKNEIQMALSGEKEFDTEFRVVWEDGTIHNIRGIAKVIRDDSGKALTFIGTNWDITIQKKNEAQLLFKNAILKAVAEATTELMAGSDIYVSISDSINIIGRTLNVDRFYFFKNDYDQENLNFTTSQKAEWNSGVDMPQIDNPELQNIPFSEISEFIKPLSQKQPFIAIVKNLEHSKTKQLLERQNILSVFVLPIFVDDEFWGFIGFDECKYERIWTEDIIALLATFSNAISEFVSRNYFENKIEYLSYHDQLTGLYNRRYYEKEIMRLDDEKYFPLTLVMLDVNGLKLTNDAFGHKVGDELLEKIASVLKAQCRENDIVARIGGDEFVILLPKTDAQNANVIIERINRAILKEKIDNIILSVSVGYATKWALNEDLNDIFKQAEDEMYRHKLSESSSMRSKTIDLIINSLFEKNNREMLHSKRVSKICGLIAQEMNFSNDNIKQIKLAGLMHDIGKIGIDEAILNKPKRLNNSEWNEIERHSEIGYRILTSANEFSKIAEFVLEHHEKWNGEGYPKKLKAEEISLEARIVAIADAYDAMTSDRTYRKALSKEEAVKELIKCAGTQFDPDIAKIFIEKVLDKEWE